MPDVNQPNQQPDPQRRDPGAELKYPPMREAIRHFQMPSMAAEADLEGRGPRVDKEMGVKGVVFDLDGVVTSTAEIHKRAWQETFNTYLPADKPYTDQEHYDFVDGRKREVGARSFLTQRGFSGVKLEQLVDTICREKNHRYNELLAEMEVQVFASTTELIKNLQAARIPYGIASSSENCAKVLERAGLTHLFKPDLIVDGKVSKALELASKPDPAIFLECCKRLGVAPHEAVVFEDAASGVQAGSSGRFGLVVGLAREGNAAQLARGGADIVVSDAAELSFSKLNAWYQHKGESIVIDGVRRVSPEENFATQADRDKAIAKAVGQEGTIETLLCIGNGRLGVRGAPPWAEVECKDGARYNYPALYIADIYDTLASPLKDKTGQEISVPNVDCVAAINPFYLNFSVDGGPWVDPNKSEIVRSTRALKMTDGTTLWTCVVRNDGKETEVQIRRCASMKDPFALVQEVRLRPLNYSGAIEVKSGLRGDHKNDNVTRYRKTLTDHLDHVAHGERETLSLLVKTKQSNVLIAAACRTHVALAKEQHDKVRGRGRRNAAPALELETITPAVTIEKAERKILQSFTQQVQRNETLCVTTVAGVHTSKDTQNDPLRAAEDTAAAWPDYATLAEESAEVWRDYWERADIVVEGDSRTQQLLRAGLMHLFQAGPVQSDTYTSEITARGLTGEAYRQHHFWDTWYSEWLYAIHAPHMARAQLVHRYHELDAARAIARGEGKEGASFAWQSADTGEETTPKWHENPQTGAWVPDNSHRQKHVSLSVVGRVYDYWHRTGDRAFMEQYGLEMMIEVARHFASIAERDDLNHFHISGVMGPNEFHEFSPSCPGGGLKDNAYVNLLTAWAMERTLEICNEVSAEARAAVLQKIGMSEGEFQQACAVWAEMSCGMALHVRRDGVVAQHADWFSLREMPWDKLKESGKYTEQQLARVDRVMESEGMSPDDFKVQKQADGILMAVYWLGKSEVERLIRRQGHELPTDWFKSNYAHYLPSTSHGSTLSRIVFAELAMLAGDKKEARKLFDEAVESDWRDIQGGTAAEGIHTGVMGGVARHVMTSYGGWHVRDTRDEGGIAHAGDTIEFTPALPEDWQTLEYTFTHHGATFLCQVNHTHIQIKAWGEGGDGKTVKISIQGNQFDLPLNSDAWTIYDLAPVV